MNRKSVFDLGQKAKKPCIAPILSKKGLVIYACFWLLLTSFSKKPKPQISASLSPNTHINIFIYLAIVLLSPITFLGENKLYIAAVH